MLSALENYTTIAYYTNKSLAAYVYIFLWAEDDEQ